MTIVFWQDNKIHELDRSQSDRSLLDYLRRDAGVKSVKEGCAQGDCGACAVTVVQADPHHGLQIRVVNSCIKPLLSLDQSLVFCASDLPPEHPVVEAMLQSDASQCGFCTPGFVMSLYGAFLEARHKGVACIPDREAALEVFSGNLCRCTGYGSLIDAALSMDKFSHPDADWLAPIRSGLAALDIYVKQSRDPQIISMLGVSGDLPIDPLVDTLKKKAEHVNASFVAGATDLGLWLSRKHQRPDGLLDLCRIPQLTVSQHDDQGWRIGAARPLQAVFDEILVYWPELKEYLERFAGRPIRSSASLGGNLASASPIGDCIPLLWAMDARLRLKSWNHETQAIQERELSIDDFLKGYRYTALLPHELIDSILIPASSKKLRLYARKISKRWEDDISSVSMVIGYSMKAEASFGDLALALGGVAEQVLRAREVEALLRGQAITQCKIAEACAALQALIRPIDDARASAAYRRAICDELFRSFISMIRCGALADAKESGY